MCVLLLLQNPHYAFAERIKAILEDGGLQLESGDRIILEGIQLAPEAIPILSILVLQKEVELEYEFSPSKGLNTDKDLPAAYLFVKTSELDFPFNKQAAGMRKKRVMVNELLLKLGAARVAKDAVFKSKEGFTQLESVARKKGEGIWSYELS